MDSTLDPRPSTLAPVQTFGQTELEALYKELGVCAHPILKLPTVEQVRGLLNGRWQMADGRGGKAVLIEKLKTRQRRIALALAEPLTWGFEADTWRDADSLLMGDYCAPSGSTKFQPPTSRPDDREQTPSTKGGEVSGGLPTAATGENSGNGLCDILAMFGGNRAQKTYYAVKRICQVAHYYPGCLLLAGAETETQSIETVQLYVHTFLAPHYEHLNGKRDHGHKFNWSRAEGFTNRRIALPNGSVMHFPTYNQDPGLYEGWEFGCRAEDYERVSRARREKDLFVPPNIGAVMDESMGLKWLKMLARRIRYRRAKVLWTFTPIHGITPAIKELVGSSAVTLESRVAELLPRRNLPELPEGHMPYVQKCMMERSYSIYFFTQYTKWGNYYEQVKASCAGKDSQYIERVAYGFARDSVARAYPKFASWNVIRRCHLPARGTNYQFNDPAGSRNWFMFWVRVGPPQWGDGNWTHYIYRDWPDAQTYGEWALATEREVSADQTKGWDGDPGPAQGGLGFGVSKYKQTILECERVKCSVASIQSSGWEREMDPYHVRLIQRAIKEGRPLDQVYEEIAERYVDPRAGASEHLADQGGTCIIDEFAEVQVDGQNRVVGPSMDLIPASGVKAEEGMQLVNNMLYWNTEEKLVALLNQPHLFVCEDCHQMRWMFENYTGMAGEKGASKDPADLARYMALAKLEYVQEGRHGGRDGRGF